MLAVGVLFVAGLLYIFRAAVLRVLSALVFVGSVILAWRITLLHVRDNGAPARVIPFRETDPELAYRALD